MANYTSNPVRRNQNTVTVLTASKTFSKADSSGIFHIATDSLIMTLPATAADFRFTFVNTGADGNNIITIETASGDKIQGSWNYGIERVTLSGTDAKDLVNTKTSAKTGDSITLVGDGSAGWYVESVQGIWLEESQVADDGVRNPLRVETDTVNKTLDASDSGKIFLMATDAKVYTLPATEIGLVYTFFNSGSDGNNIITISPNSSDAIHGTITLAASVVVLSGTDDKDVINTKASSTTGDSITLVGDGSVGWFVQASTGIWASEA